MPVVLGIDLAAGRGITEVAALIVTDGSRTPLFEASSHRRVTTDDEILAVVADTQPAVLAVDAPLSLPRPVMQGLLSGLSRGRANTEAPALSAAGSPYTRAAERDPIWTSLGIRPLPVSFLGGLTFRAISLLPKLHAVVPQAAIIEVFPSATLRCLGITSLAARGTAAQRRSMKTNEFSRQSTQRGLSAFIQGIPQPDDETYGADLLDALAAALTAVAYVRDAYVLVGDGVEGAIVLPRVPNGARF